MKHFVSDAFVLRRVDFAEADRIITVITPTYGKRSLIAKAARRSQSKLAGGIEIFNQNNLSFIEGKSDLATLVSSRLIKSHTNIISDINVLNFGYEVLKLIDNFTEQDCEPTYYNLLSETLESLNDKAVSLNRTKLYFFCQLAKFDGRSLNSMTTTNGSKLQAELLYQFNFESMSFFEHELGEYTASHIKLIRLAESGKLGTLKSIVVDEGVVLIASELVKKALLFG
jgi:DNA repair protein RecO